MAMTERGTEVFIPRRSTATDDAMTLKLALLRRAAQIIATTDPLSMTFRAAARVLEVKLDGQFERYLDRPEQTEVVQEMIAGLRQVIQADPDTAGQWVSALRVLRTAEEKLLDPTKWTTSAPHRSRAAEVLGCPESDVFSLRIGKDGKLYARQIGGEYVNVPVETA